MSEMGLPFGGEPAATPDQVETRRRRWLLPAIGALVVAVGAGAFLGYQTLSGGGGDKSPAPVTAATHSTVRPGVRPGVRPTARATGSPTAAPSPAVSPYDDALGRDPFHALYVAPAAAASGVPGVGGVPAGGQSTVPPTSRPAPVAAPTAFPTTGGSQPTGAPTSAPTTASAGAPSTAPQPTPSYKHVVTFTKIDTTPSGRRAEMKVDNMPYSPAEGEVFDHDFKLVKLDDCSVFLFGDSRFALCTGQTIALV